MPPTTRAAPLLMAMLALTGLRASAAEQPDTEQQVAARRLLEAGRWEEALKAFKGLDSDSGGRCAACVLGMAEAQLQLHKDSDAIKSCDRALRLGLTDAPLRLQAHNLKAMALGRRSGDDPATLQEVEHELRLALQDGPDDADARFNLGYALLRQRRDTEGATELQRALELHPQGTIADQARLLIGDPRRARERFAPEFSLLTAQGEELGLAQLKGRVVIIDFWATWCRPCVAAVPELHALMKKYPSDQLVVVSISADQDEQAWRDFVEKKAMSWPQYLDKDRRIQKLFGVNVFPTYLVIDGEGIVRKELRGTNPQKSVAYRLKETLAEFPQLKPR